MTALYNWVGNITFYLIFITVVSSLLPNKKYEKYLKLFAGMVLILLVLQPLTGSLRLEDKIAYYFESITFQNESDDLKKELLGIENQRLHQMVRQYEEAVANDVEMMAKDMEFYPRYTKITIDSDQASSTFGTVIHIQMTVSRESDEEDGGGDGTQHGLVTQETTIETIETIEPVQIGKEMPTTVAVPDEGLNRLRRKVEGYYGLETADVEIGLEERER